MDFESIVKLIHSVSESDLTGFQYEENGITLKLKKEQGKVKVINAPTAIDTTALEALTETTDAGASEEKKDVVKPEGNVVVCPLVGTFYTSPAQDAEPFVKVGDTVKKGQTLAIVEAMKLMNEIESDFDGVVEEVLVRNEQAVEYGQPLFRIS